MKQLLEVESDHIGHLNDQQLTGLLKRLATLEAGKHQLPAPSITVSMNVDVPDDGEDGRVVWQDGPQRTKWFPSRLSIFQCKATPTGPKALQREILAPGGNELKKRIEETFDNGGTYVLFYYKPCNTSQKKARIEAIREVLEELGKPYAKTASIEVYGAGDIAAWANEHLAAVAWACAEAGRPVPTGLLRWEQWSRYPEFRFAYVKNDTLDGYIRQIRGHLARPRRSARVVGLSGLGKTRLALETFRPPEREGGDERNDPLCESMVYLDARSGGDLPALMRQWRTQCLRGIVVVDDCAPDLHEALHREIAHTDSNLSLLTLDFNPENPQPERQIIRLEPVSEEVIDGILGQAYPGLSQSERGRIGDFAQGFPKLATLLADAQLNEVNDLSTVTRDDLVEKLLWGRGSKSDVAYAVIAACALFERLGFDGVIASERQFVANEVCRVDSHKFYSHARDFIDRGILQKRGRYVRVEPLPLAVRLAADWWRKCSPERAQSMLNELTPRLAEALCDRMALLDFLPEAQELVRTLCSDNGPFSRPEMLNSEEGSRLFRPLVETNPEATLHALVHAFGNWSTEELLSVGPGRRSIIWALEKLCFRRETFPPTARLLLAFAAAENESWSNNATGQFLQLYHLYLSGTQAPPSDRLAIVDEALSSQEDEKRELAIRALGAAFQTGHFSRKGGVETQGSRPPEQDWRPKDGSEMRVYWNQCLERLVPIAKGDEQLGELAREQISGRLPGLVRAGFVDELDTALKTIIDARGRYWLDGLEAVRSVLRWGKVADELEDRLRQWESMLQPESMPDRLRLIVSVPPFDHEKDDDGQFVDLSAQRAAELAEEFAGREDKWPDELPILFEGEQCQAYTFGLRLAELLESPGSFLAASIAALSAAHPESANPTLLGGFLAGIRSEHPNVVAATLDSMASDPILQSHVVAIAHMVGPTTDDLDRLLRLLSGAPIPIESLRRLAYGRGFSNVEPQAAISFLRAISRHSLEGALVALDGTFMYCRDDLEKSPAGKNLLREILRTPDLLRQLQDDNDMESFAFQEVAKWLLEGEEDIELATHLAREIVSLAGEDEYAFRLDHTLESVVAILLAEYVSESWPIFADGLTSDDWRTRHRIQHLLGPHSWDEGTGILFHLPDHLLMKWCADNPERAPLVVARMMPLYSEEDGEWRLHPFANAFIERFGDRDDVLLEISRNMTEISWSGSAVPVYRRQEKILIELAGHRLPSVREWANERLPYVQQRIHEERMSDEEREIGVY